MEVVPLDVGFVEDVDELPVDLEVEEESVVVVLLELVDEFDAVNVRCKKLEIISGVRARTRSAFGLLQSLGGCLVRGRAVCRETRSNSGLICRVGADTGGVGPKYSKEKSRKWARGMRRTRTQRYKFCLTRHPSSRFRCRCLGLQRTHRLRPRKA